jgi:hypothetical protein
LSARETDIPVTTTASSLIVLSSATFAPSRVRVTFTVTVSPRSSIGRRHASYPLRVTLSVTFSASDERATESA